MTGVARVYRWELAEAARAEADVPRARRGDRSSRSSSSSCSQLQTGGPNDVPLGRYIRDTGLAMPFVVLFFMSIWAFPLITALVAGDIVASESHNGTLKTILTRSRERGEIFAGKVLAAAHLHGGRRRSRWASSALRRRRHRLGVPPADLALRHDGARRPRRSACSSRASASTCCRSPASRRSGSCSRR